MQSLARTAFQSVSSDAMPLAHKACQPHLAALPEWQIIEHDGIMKLMRRFAFRDFADALAFTQRVGEVAEQAGHHPVIVTEWGRTTVTWWTHTLRGLHLNDFILAARTDEVVE